MTKSLGTQRNYSNGFQEQSNKDNIENKTCPKCGHDRMWKPRGQVTPQYRNKCCKCMHTVGFEAKRGR